MISLIVMLTALVPFMVKDDFQQKVEAASVDTIYVHIDSIIYPASPTPIGIEVDTLIAIPWNLEEIEK